MLPLITEKFRADLHKKQAACQTKLVNSEESQTYARFMKNITAYAEARAAQAQRAATAYMEIESAGTNSTAYVTGSGEAAGAQSCKETESSTAYAEARSAMTQLSAILRDDGSGEAAEAGNAGEATESGIQAEHPAATQAESAAVVEASVPYEDSQDQSAAMLCNNTSFMEIISAENSASNVTGPMKESRANRAWRSTKRAFSYLFCCCIPERREECLTYI